LIILGLQILGGTLIAYIPVVIDGAVLNNAGQREDGGRDSHLSVN